jgi:hypothetical protein
VTTTIRLRPPPAKLLHPLEGFGAQFNTNLFITRGPTAGEPRKLTRAQLEALQGRIDALEPGLSRILVRRGLRPGTAQGRSAPQFVALMDTIALAQHAEADLNLTWWGQGPYAVERRLRALRWPNRSFRDWPDPRRRKWPPELTEPGGITEPRHQMERFAGIVEQARLRGVDCVRSLTVQNEVNAGSVDIAKQHDQFISMRFYELLYRFLDDQLRRRADPLDPEQTLRETVRLVAGDLVLSGNSPQDAWLRYLHRNMELPREHFRSVLDGYSIHVYWEPGPGPQGFPERLQSRLTGLERTIRRLRLEKPVYVTEFGVRRLHARPHPGRLDGVRIEETITAAFQHAWFSALAPQYGIAGLSKWVLYRTDRAADFGEWGMIGPSSTEFRRWPTYRVIRLFNHVVDRGWQAAGLGRAPGGGLLATKFVSQDKRQESAVVLNNTSGARQVRLVGLKPRRSYFAVAWNRDGTGSLATLPRVRSDAGGAATLTVPRHGLVALSTRRPGL